MKSKTKSFFIINIILLGISVIFYVLCVLNQDFAEMYSRTVSSYLRIVMSYISGIFPFSIAELFVVIGIPSVIIYAVYIITLAFKKRNKKTSKHIQIVFGIASLALVIFINNFGVCYHRYSLEKNLGIERSKIDKYQLYEGALFYKSILEEQSQNIKYDVSGASKMPVSFNEISDSIDLGYNKLIKKFDFLSNCNVNSKRIALSQYLTYSHISGMYMPLTAEANVNTNYPDYVVTFSMAHEKAHQRGIAGEDEANFVAFLACMSSDNEYVKYSALMSMYDYYLASLSRADSEMYLKLLSLTSKEIMGEMYAYYNFFEKYANSNVSKIADKVNDTYLKVQGQESGTQSYGLVVELSEAYRKKETQ